MVTKPSSMTPEAIAALTDKKMDMTLDDIIKMERKPSYKAKKTRIPNKRGGFTGPSRDNYRVQKFMESRSSLRQGALAKRRSKFQENHFPMTNEVARKAAAASVSNRTFSRRRVANRNNIRVGLPPKREAASEGAFAGGRVSGQKQRPRTLDSLFANLKEQRMQQQQILASNNQPINAQQRQGQQWARGRGNARNRASYGRGFGNRYTR